jgi:rRNA-processing protein FCF1
MSLDDWPGSSGQDGLLIDTNLLILFIAGRVNPKRIQSFKRTTAYDRVAYELLVKTMAGFSRLFTVAHVMAEVSNLTDMDGRERMEARRVLAETIAVVHEPHVASVQASKNWSYGDPGLTDAAISVVARELGCAVLTDDLGLCLLDEGGASGC